MSRRRAVVPLQSHKAVNFNQTIMSKTEKQLPATSKARTSRERLAERILQRFPDRRFETEDDVYDALDEYDSFVCEHYEKMLSDQNKLGQLMFSNPRVGAFISDVVEGEDALVACVRYFGKELFDSSTDAQKMHALRVANDEFAERNRSYLELEKAMKENVERSTRSIERFMRSKKMTEEELDDFIDRMFHVCSHVFAGDLREDVLELLYKGLHYDADLSCAEHAGEVKGRNRRIVMERREAAGDKMPTAGSGNAAPQSGSGYRRTRRRNSVWDM